MTQVTRNLKGYLEPQQIARLIQAATNPRDALLVRIPWRTGMKVSESIGIRIQDIDFENRAIVIRVKKMRRENGEPIEWRRVVPIDRDSLEMVEEYLEWRKQFPYKGDLLFPITRQRVNQIFWKLGSRTGITKIGHPAVSKHTKFHPHLLRHSFSIHCIKHGMSIDRLQKILGYQVATTLVYPQHSLKDLHQDYDRVWGDDEE